MSTTWNELRELAIIELKERLDAGWLEDIYGPIYEIADSLVPCQTWDLLELALDNLRIASVQPEWWPSFDWSNTPINLIAANVYEFLVVEMDQRIDENLNKK